MDFKKIEKTELTKLDLVGLSNNIKSEEYRSYFLSEPSKEHYRLLSYISLSEDNINLLDIGTLKGCSSLAMSINAKNKIFSFDVSNSFDLFEQPKNTEFFIDNILLDKYENIILYSKYILLDTFHDGVFEKEFYEYLKNIKYQGFLLLDDIHLNNDMEEFWNSIEKDKDDITEIGHITGTGVVYFK